jgi:hypothetical protein
MDFFNVLLLQLLYSTRKENDAGRATSHNILGSALLLLLLHNILKKLYKLINILLLSIILLFIMDFLMYYYYNYSTLYSTRKENDAGRATSHGLGN